MISIEPLFDMPNLFVIAICLAAILLAAIVTKRIRLKKESEQLSAKIRCIPSYESTRINEERKFAISTCNKRFFADIDKGLIDLRAPVLHGVSIIRFSSSTVRYSRL